MQLVLVCVLVLSLLQPGLLQDGGTEATPTNGGGGGDLSQSITELKNIVLAQSKQMVDFSYEVRGQLATINATVNSLQGQLESLTGEVARNQWKITQVNRRMETIESGQAVCQNTSSQLANTTEEFSTGLNQLKGELTANKRTVCEKVDDVMAQLQIVHTTFSSQLVNATDQLSTELNQLKRELTANEQNCDLAHNTTQVKNNSIETPQDPLDTPEEQNTCGGTPGWRRVAFLNMTDPSQDCPSGWSLTTHSVRTCGRASSQGFTCDPVTFPVSGGEYSRVCGRIRGYQFGIAWAFSGINNPFSKSYLNGSYVDGISITHGQPRQHIWTFAVGLAQAHCYSHVVYIYCYCDVQTHPLGDQAIPPSFVGNDYFCESGVSGRWERNYRLFSENPLWDGQNCGQNRTCCSMNNPPYFMKDLPAPTADDIEVRICSDNELRWSDYPIELLELYVQ